MTESRRLLRLLAAAVEQARPVALATVVETSRSVPRHAGTKMLVFGDGNIEGTVGGGELEARVIDEARRTLEIGRPRMVEYSLVDRARGDPGICGGEVKVYVEPYMPAHTVFVIGCGHVGKAVVELATWLGFRTVAVDDRPEFVSEEALPGATVRFAGTVAEAVREIAVTSDASCVVVTRSPDLDVELLPHLLATPARYIGVMGSSSRWLATRKKLVELGIAGEDLERVHVPIGLDVNAETLEEIAVSIMAEVIREYRSDAVR